MEAVEELRYLILAVQREGNRALGAALRPLGLTPSQAEVIGVLAEREPLTLSGLGELLICESGSSPSRLVDRLVAAGLVERATSATDRRQVTLSLTTAGRRLSKRVQVVQDELHDMLDGAIGGRSVKSTLTLLRAMVAGTAVGDALDRRRTPPA